MFALLWLGSRVSEFQTNVETWLHCVWLFLQWEVVPSF